MNLISPRISFNISALVAFLLIISTFVFGDGVNQAGVVWTNIIAIVVLLAGINHNSNFLKKEDSSNLRISFLLTFLGAIIISFLPYLLDFTSAQLLVPTSIASGLWLLVLFFTNTKSTK